MCGASLWYAHATLGNILEDVSFLLQLLDSSCYVCHELHNLCIDWGDISPVHNWHDDVRDGDAWVVHDNYRNDDAELRGRPAGDH
jgi:hypothetical protein